MRKQREINRYSYLILGIIHFIILLFTFCKSNDRRKHLMLLLSYTGFAYLFEYVVVILFNGYEYKPKLLRVKPLDNILGAIFSQFFYVPSVALFITVFELGWKVKLFFSIFFTLIERLFIYLGLFRNKWWKTRYTFSLIFISFFFNDLWYKVMKKEIPIVLFASMFHALQVTTINIIYLYAARRIVRYGKGKIFSWKEHFRIGSLLGFLVSLITTGWLKSEKGMNKLKALLLMIMVDWILYKKELLQVKTILVFPVKYFIILFSAFYYRKWIDE